MPTIMIYVKSEAWRNLLRECKGDEREARRKIARMVNEKYAEKRV